MSPHAARALENQIRRMTPVSAPPDEREDVEALSRVLGAFLERKKGRRSAPRCELVGPRGEQIRLPEAVFYMLERVVEVLARGDAITLVPVGKALTTQQAADLLNVSRQYLVRLLDAGQIPFTRTGKHRRVRIEDVLAYRQKRDDERQAALDELTSLTEELGGYDDLQK